MSQDPDIMESFSILDVIKIKLNDLLIQGIENIGIRSNSELLDLKNKLGEMNFTTLSELLGSFLEKIKGLSQKPIPLNLKKEISIEVLRIIAVTRMFERIMNIESVKKTLQEVE